MLKHIHIRDFAILTELELDFSGGLTVFTGETGAGKSILIEALGLVLGERADSGMVRQGAERADISAIFDISQQPGLIAKMDELGIEPEDHEYFARRQIRADGGSRAWLNGNPVPVQVLRELGDELVDIHGQHEHQSLLRRDEQRRMLDEFGELDDSLSAVSSACKHWQSVQSELAELGDPTLDRSAETDLLRYQIEELEACVISADALERLEADHRRLDNLQQILAGSQQAIHQLYDADDAISQQLAQVTRQLQTLQALDPKLDAVVELVDSAAIQLGEAEAEFRHYQDSLEMSPEELQAIEVQLEQLHDLARKHRVDIRELPEHLQSLQARLAVMENSESRYRELQDELERAMDSYRQAAKALSDLRQQVACTLSDKVSGAMQELGMAGGVFSIDCVYEADARPTLSGNDQLEFLVSANPGQSPRPLRKVASGGELSRISLAIQVITSRVKGVPTLVFDEVDTGIGGGVAEVVGQKLHLLAESRQVMCVTHLAQVASQGDQHIRVSKQRGTDSTLTELSVLDGEARVEEIARMLGGVKLTNQTLAHAREMLGEV